MGAGGTSHAPRTVAVAVSGGRDSIALLHVTMRQARELGLQVVALHVQHGLVPGSQAWGPWLRERCARWARAGWPVRCQCRALTGAPAPGDSVEAWARRERYQALAQMAHEAGAGLVLLAHHRRDQAETVLLQALRGAGAAGMAAMGPTKESGGVLFARPWLRQSREAIEAYVRRHRLRFVEDPSNADERFARNRLRRRLWDPLLRAFPHGEGALAGAARRLHEADACARDLAGIDWQTCASASGGLQVSAWSRLAPHRQANVLRHWLSQVLHQGAPDSLAERLMEELARARGGARWPAPVGRLVLRRGVLEWVDGPRLVPPKVAAVQQR